MNSEAGAAGKQSSPARRWLDFGLMALAVVFIVGAGIDVGRRLSTGQFSFRGPELALGALSFALSYLALCWGFVRFVRLHSTDRPRTLVVAEVFFRSLLVRYIPGKVALPAARAAASPRLGMGSALLAASAVLEMLAWLSTGALGCALLGAVTGAPRALPGAPSRWVFAALVVPAVIGLIVLCTMDRRRYPARLLKLLRCDQGDGPLVPFALVVSAALYWTLAAACSASVAISAGGDQHAALLAALATLASSLAGFLALPVPAGMGVREVVFTVVLGPGLGDERALAVALVTRAMAIALECLLWMGCVGLGVRGAGARDRRERPHDATD